MFGIIWKQTIRSAVASALTMIMLGVALAGCGEAKPRSAPPATGESATLVGKISEVAPPEAIQILRQAFNNYQPQVRILSPQPNEILTEDRIAVYFQVKDLPLFKDQTLGLGPHLHVFLDNQPYQPVYSLNEPLVLTDLTPGTHTLRAFAARPWYENFKNEGAYTQTTFHVLTKTPDNQLLPNQPSLTYSHPQGTYGAEPIMLDFYLTNAPLHLIAQERSDDDLKDWMIRCTVNGEQFTFDTWEPIYLKGFKPGKNWVQLELLDEDGKAIANSFNNTVRVITYEPGGEDTLSKLVRGELSAEAARGIVDPNYSPAPEPLPTLERSPEPDPESAPTPLPEAIPNPEPEPTPTVEPEGSIPASPPAPETELPGDSSPAETPALSTDEAQPEESGVDGTSRAPEITPTPTPKSARPGGFFNRFRRRPAEAPAVPASPASASETPSGENTLPVELTPDATEASPAIAPSPETKSSAEAPLDEAPLDEAPLDEAPLDEAPSEWLGEPEPKTILDSPTTVPSAESPFARGSKFFDRLRHQFPAFSRPSPAPSPSPTLLPDNGIALPETAQPVEPSLLEAIEEEQSSEPPPSDAPEVPLPVPSPTPQYPNQQPNEWFNRLRQQFSIPVKPLPSTTPPTPDRTLAAPEELPTETPLVVPEEPLAAEWPTPSPSPAAVPEEPTDVIDIAEPALTVPDAIAPSETKTETKP